MKRRTTLFGLAAAVAIAAMPLAALADEQPPATAEDMAKWFHEDAIVEFDFVKEYAALPKREDVMIIDSRPAGKYDAGHIPTAVLMPDSQFEEMAPTVLPEAKDQLLIFYCGGYACALSHKSAFKAEEAGYTNIKVYAAGEPDWTFKGGVPALSTTGLMELQATGAPLVLIDSRPANKVGGGTIPGAIVVPDSQFDAFAGMLPADKATKLVFYCGGLICKLSENSAYKAMALGYTNVSTYPGGFPAWKEEVKVIAMNVAPGGEAAALPTARPAGEGAFPTEEFIAVMGAIPDDMLVVDVRDADEFERGTLTGAINMPVGELEDLMFELPDDKRIVFICTSGGRSSEAYDLVKLLRADLNVAYLDAIVKYNGDGTVEVTAN